MATVASLGRNIRRSNWVDNFLFYKPIGLSMGLLISHSQNKFCIYATQIRRAVPVRNG